MTDTSADVEEAVAAWRRLNPELARKVDRIAEIIAPDAFGEVYNGLGADADELVTARREYRKARARRKTMEILRFLGEAPETTDWAAIFEEMDGLQREDPA